MGRCEILGEKLMFKLKQFVYECNIQAELDNIREMVNMGNDLFGHSKGINIPMDWFVDNKEMVNMGDLFGHSNGINVPMDWFASPITHRTEKQSIEENKMSDHLVEALQSNFYTVKVKYNKTERQLYTFKVSNDLVLNVGDLVLIQSSNGSFFRSVEVVAVDIIRDINYNANFEYKWVVSKIDLAKFNSIIEQEQLLIHELELTKKRNEGQILLEFSGLSDIDIDNLKKLGSVL